MPTFETKRVKISSLTRFEESGSLGILSLCLFSQCRLTWTIPSGYPSSRKHGEPAMCQVLRVIQKKIKFFLFGAEILTEKTDVQTITV